MTYRFIQTHFQTRPVFPADQFKTNALLVGKSPDGDTIGADLKATGQFGAKVKNTIRYLHIDTRETHFAGFDQGKTADLATDLNLKLLGVTKHMWSLHRRRLDYVEPVNLSVKALHKGTDRYKRVLGLPFRHDFEVTKGISNHLTANDPNFINLLNQTVNYTLVKSGMAYATFFDQIDPVEISVFHSAYEYAKKQKLGVWADGADLTYTGIYIRTLQDVIGEKALIHPTLFRRLITYFKKHPGTFNPNKFKQFIASQNIKYRAIKDDFFAKGILEIQEASLDSVLQPEVIELKDIIQIDKAPDNKGFVLKITRPYAGLVRLT
ncbi:hypothetical protein BVY03_01835 [bacterium K02(2017)]|nr:hypothetical protein BVY03_01835 [bacterium K02(2017)]